MSCSALEGLEEAFWLDQDLPVGGLWFLSPPAEEDVVVALVVEEDKGGESPPVKFSRSSLSLAMSILGKRDLSFEDLGSK